MRQGVLNFLFFTMQLKTADHKCTNVKKPICTQADIAIPPSEKGSVAFTLPLLPLLAVDTNSFLQQSPAVKEMTQHLQLRKHRHSKRPQLPPGEAGSRSKRIVHSENCKPKLSNYNESLINCEKYLDSLFQNQINDLNKIVSSVNDIANKLRVQINSSKIYYNLPS